MRCIEFLHNFVFGIPNFGIRIPISQCFNSGIQEKNFNQNLWNQNEIKILLPMGVPEVGTKNWNSHPSPAH
jgi:hypothetical protein